MLAAAFIQLCAAATAACTLLPNVQRAAASAKAVLPPALPLDVFTVAPCAAAEAATCAPPSPLLVNAPRVAWQQGDAGEAAASPSGYIRLFGSALAFSAPPLARHGWGVQPNFYTTFVNNTVAVGNAWGGQTGGFATVAANDQGALTLNRGVVFRGNFAIGGSTADVIVEGCAVRRNEVGIAVDANTTRGVWLRGNSFEGVGEEVRGFTSYAPGLSCCCNATDPATGVPTVVKPFASYFSCSAGSCEAHGEPDPW